MDKRHIKRIISVILTTVLLLLALPMSVNAADSGQVVVVGACTDLGVSKNGSEYTGFAYDYLAEIQKFTGHRYSFVEGSRDDLLQMLADGKIDILPCVSEDEFDQWRQQYFNPMARSGESTTEPALSNISLVKKFTAIYVPESGGKINYFDTDAINNATIGYLAEDKSKYFADGAFIRGDIDGADYVEYSTESQMQQDFISGKLDAVIKECFRCWNNEKIIYQFNTKDCYFMTSGRDPLLAGQLDVAVNSIFMQNSSYAADMYSKHMSKYGVPKFAFSNAEKSYIENTPEITIAYNLSSSILETYDGNNGELTGVTGDILMMLERFTGIKIRLRACNTLEECVDLLEKGGVQAICGGVNNGSMDPFGKFRVSTPYYTVPIVVSGKSNSQTTSFKKLAIPYDSDDISQFMRQIYPSATILPYENVIECMTAVRDGQADVACAGAYETIYAINNGYSDMMVLGVTTYSHGESFAYAEDCPAELSSIFGKCIAQLINYSSVAAAFDSAATVDIDTTSSVPKENFYLIIVVFAVLAIGVALFVMLSHIKSKRAHQIDPLTGGRNKSKLIDDTKKLLKKIPAEKLAVVLFDINKFKYVNDRLGYEEGDRMLVRLHKTISDQLDDGEIFGRLTDDNFALIIRNAQDNEITIRMNNIFAEFERRNSLFVKYPVVFSAGVCRLGQCRDGGKDIDLNTAFDRCKIAKRTLKGLHYSSIAYYDGKIRDKALREKDYETLMPTALIQREFECYLQPKYGLKSRHIEGAEALIRWNSKEFGFVFPNEFIPISEKNGFVVELDFFILEEVCRAMRRWLDEGKKPVVISVNQSRLHLNNDDYIWRLREIVDKYEIPYEYIELELTESVFTENAEKLLVIMQKLHDIGFKLSLDDFGSGYSSLNMLKDIPVDVVKIDREFFNGTVNSEKGRAVISTVVDLAKNLNMEVISEGVETLEQVEFLTEINCAMVQGYYFAKPMNMAAFEELWSRDLAMIEAENEAASQQIVLTDVSDHTAE